MLLENLILKNKTKLLYYWRKLPDFIDSGEINLAQIQVFFDLNKRNIENSLINLFTISEINFIFSLLNFHVKKLYPTNPKEEHIYSAKFFLFKFFCNYISDYPGKINIIRKNFIAIMQQAFLSKSSNYDQENYQNIIIDMVAKYLDDNDITIPFSIILPMIHKSSNKKNFLGLFDATDPQKKIIPPEIIQEKIADYLFFSTKNVILYIPDIISFRRDLEKINARIKKDQIFMNLSEITEYNQKLDDYSKELENDDFFWIEFFLGNPSIKIYDIKSGPDKTHFWGNSLSKHEKNRAFFNAYHLHYKSIEEKSTKSMKNIVNIARKKVSALKQKEISLSDGNRTDSAIETSGISSPNHTPEIITNKLNHI